MLKSRDITLPTKISIVKAMVFPVVMNGCETLNHKEGWALKNWCFWTVVLEKTLWSPLNSKDIKPVNPKGNQSWILIGRTDVEAEAPILGHLMRRTDSLDAGKDWRQEEKGATEDGMVGWHHWLNGRRSGWTPGGGDRQGGVVCFVSWGCKVSDRTERLNWTEL